VKKDMGMNTYPTCAPQVFKRRIYGRFPGLMGLKR